MPSINRNAVRLGSEQNRTHTPFVVDVVKKKPNTQRWIYVHTVNVHAICTSNTSNDNVIAGASSKQQV